MSNYYGFTHGGTQYGAPPTPYQQAQTGFPHGGQPAYPTQNYQTAAPSAPSQPAYEYGYGKTYYQQAPQATTAYAAPAQTYESKATYAQPPKPPTKPPVTQYQAAYVTTSSYQTTSAPGGGTKTTDANAAAPAGYSNYDAALYSAATMYAAQQGTKQAGQFKPGWKQFNKPGLGAKGKFFQKQPAKPQQIHYCEVCKISCAGPQTYREHLEGQKHKKREALQKQAQEGKKEAPVSRTTNSLHCELCDVTCTGNDAYAAHVRGSKHQKVVKLHTKLGKPIPSSEPQVIGKKDGDEGAETSSTEEVQPVGNEYIEELKDEEGKVISFNCKLCDCKFNDPNAKEMHMKGRRHRLQYKKKVQPDLVVEVKPNMRNRKLADSKGRRHDEFWNRRHIGDDEESMPPHWAGAGGGRYDQEFDYWMQPPPFMRRGPPGMFFNMMPGRRPETADDRHVAARHAEIYPKEDELKAIQRIVSHTERALKLVSDSMAGIKAEQATTTPTKAEAEKKEETGENKDKAANSNQMISFQKDAEGTVRMLKGVMRVGLLAKGLLLQGDKDVQLVVLCAEKPTTTLLKRVAQELPVQLKIIAEELNYIVKLVPTEGSVTVSDGTVTVKVSLTSPLLREQDPTNTATEQANNKTSSEDLLPREPCLQALAALRHAKWFQARATGLPSCVMVMRIMRDMCQRIPTWTQLNQWAMELLVEKVIASANAPLSPGDCLRRVMEAFASGIMINGPGIMDPCEKEPQDALGELTKQHREDITHSAQQFLRFISFRQIHRVLGMEQLPPPKFIQARGWRTNRKRRRSGTEGGETETDGKVAKKENGQGAEGEAKTEG